MKSLVDAAGGYVSVYGNRHALLLTVRQGLPGDRIAEVILEEASVERLLNELNTWLAAKRAGLLSDDSASPE